MIKIELINTEEYINGDKCKNNVYPLNNKNLSCARSTITGRYPTTGYCVNEACDELIYVLEGQGTLNKEKETIFFKKDDAIMIEKNEKFYWDGNCQVLAICNPAWFESQHKEKEN